ncbi:DUF3093 domain-containing protein [Frigoribacterium salinisoli]
MPTYRERLLPPIALFVATALLLPATLLVFVPISVPVGVVVAVALYAAVVVALLASSPVLVVDEEGFRAGPARLLPAEVGEATAHRGADATTQRGPGLDARAWTLFRGWVSPVVRVALTDEADPAPYWLVSTRRPEELVRALDDLRRRTPGR